MDMTWVTERIALGAAIWSDSNMQTVARSGVTHIIDMQIEFDDTELARPYGIEVLWNGTDDDFQPKPPELFERGVEFGQAALSENGGKLYIHCAAGVHRAAMMTLALLGAMGWETDEAMQVIQGRRPVVDFADVYVQSVEGFLRQRELSRGVEAASDSQDGKNGPSRKSRNKNRI
jgi:protein-tyrosine phosphatase